VARLLSVPSASGSGPQADGAISGHTAALVASTLGSADGDVQQAASLLGTQAVRKHSTAPLQTMISWAPAQQRRLATIVGHLPAGAVHDRVEASRNLVDQAYARAQALRSDLGCGCLSTSGTDRLGPLPCSACTPPGTQPPAPGTPAPGSATPGVRPHSPTTQASSGTGTRNGGTHTGHTRDGSTSSRGSSAAAPAPGGGLIGAPSPTSGVPTKVLPSLPHVPLPSTTVPPNPIIGTDSCGATVGLGPIGIGLGTCGVHVKIGG
jgi:hypothetical protein